MSQVRKFKVYLEPEQRKRLEAIVHNGHAPAKKILHAQILLMTDQEHPQGRWKDEQIVRALGVHRNTISRIRRRFVEQGEAPALNRRVRAEPPTPPKLDGEREAQLVAICCSPPPDGRVRWSLSLLVEELKDRQIVASICRETVRRTLKKTRSSRGGKSATAFPSGMRPVL
jgi:transposase